MPGCLIIFDLIALIIFNKDTNYEIPPYAVFSFTLLLPVFGFNSLLITLSHVRFVVITSIIPDVMSHSLLRRYRGSQEPADFFTFSIYKTGIHIQSRRNRAILTCIWRKKISHTFPLDHVVSHLRRF
jgi:hypothetical protein